MTRYIVVVIMLLAPIAAWAAGAPRTLSWDDLAPPVDDIQARFSDLSEDQLGDLYELYSLRKWRQGNDNEASNSEGVKAQIAEYEQNLAAQNLDVAGLLKKIDAAMEEFNQRRSQPIKSLDGVEVRLPGYVLPLEFTSTAVSEFFLVPYVGACIHTPPPDANQIVLVKLNQNYQPRGLYDAVWVTGKIKIVQSKHKLGYRDGVGDVSSTYQIDGVEVTPYQQ